jgi:hypothetical protein
MTLSLVLACAAGSLAADEPPCTPQEREATLRALQQTVLDTFPHQVDSLSDAVKPGGPLEGWFLSHGHVVMANSGAVSVGTRRPGSLPQLLFYAPSPSSRPESWLDFDGPDGPYQLVGWGNLVPYQPGSAPPSRRCIDGNEWFVHEAGWHTMDGGMTVTAGAREEPARPATGVPIYYWHPQLWDIHFWVGGGGIPTISPANPRAPGGGLHLPHNANFDPRKEG